MTVTHTYQFEPQLLDYLLMARDADHVEVPAELHELIQVRNTVDRPRMTKYVTRNGVNVIYLVIGEESSCEWLKNNGFKYAHASKAEELIPALVSKVGEFLA